MIISFIQNSNCIDISKLMGFCIGSLFSEKKIWHIILVTNSLSGYYQLEFDTIYLQ